MILVLAGLGVITAAGISALWAEIRRGQERFTRNQRGGDLTALADATREPPALAEPPQPAPGHHCGPVAVRINMHAGGCLWRWDRDTRTWHVVSHQDAFDPDEWERKLTS